MAADRLPLVARRALAAGLVLAGTAALAAGALAPDLPFADSLALARRYWTAGPATRLLNAPAFAREPELARAALALAGTLPLERDVALVLDPATPPAAAEQLRRRAAYLLAPRRVRVVHGEAGAHRLVPIAPDGDAR